MITLIWKIPFTNARKKRLRIRHRPDQPDGRGALFVRRGRYNGTPFNRQRFVYKCAWKLCSRFQRLDEFATRGFRMIGDWGDGTITTDQFIAAYSSSSEHTLVFQTR